MMPALSDEKTPGTTHITEDVLIDTPDPTHANLERRLVRKLDLRMSITMVIYTLNLIDRANIANARLQGFERDLHLRGEEYAVTISILYFGYISMQVPANMFLYWLQKPSLFIPGCTIAWGAVSVLTGVTRNYTGALLARFFLGFLEAPFYPGIIFLLSGWYKRDELALRAAIVSCGVPISSAFGSLIASGILAKMQGILGQAAWRWLFYIEGGATIFVAICAIFIFPDFPHNTKWLTPEERSLVISRLAEDGYGRDALAKKTNMQGLREAVSDWKVWWFSVALFLQYTGQSFYLYFPTLGATMGYDTTVTLLLLAPPWVFSAVVLFAITRYSDKKQKRYRYYVASNAVAALGFIISISTMNIAARYISLFLMAQVSAGLIVIWSWINNTFAGEPAKRAVAVALISALASIGAIVGSYIWPLNWGPTYRYSYIISLALLCLSTAMFGLMHLHLKRLNEEMDKMELNVKGNEAPPAPIQLRYLL